MKADRGLLHIQVINTCRWEKALSKEHSRRNVHHNQGVSPREEKNISFIEENYTTAFPKAEVLIFARQNAAKKGGSEEPPRYVVCCFAQAASRLSPE